jgi:hypothetical protein
MPDEHAQEQLIRKIVVVDGPAHPAAVEHLVTWQESPSRTVVLGLDATCRPVYLTTLYALS